LPIADWRLPIDGLPISDWRLTDCRLPIAGLAIVDSIDDCQSSVHQSVNPQSTIRNRQSAIDNPSIANPQSTIGNRHV
jgi:hypothetical protein